MKYKNRLIVPTLVSTSLLASAMVANAEEVDQDEQYSGQSTEEYAVNDETSETDLDLIESEEASEEETEDEESEDKNSEDDSEEKELEEDVEETDELEEAETTESEDITVEDTAVESEDQQTAEQNDESEVAAPVEEESTPVEKAGTEEFDENNVEEVITESSEEPAEEVEEPAESKQNTQAPVEAAETEDIIEEDAAVESDVQEAVEQVETADQETEEQSDEAEETAPSETVEEPAEEAETEESDEKAAVENNTEEEPAESEQNTEAPASEEPVEEVSAEEPVESDEKDAVEQESEVSNSEEDATYKYDSESLKEELESLSEKEQTAFLEENADDIEVDEEMLSDLTETLAKENEELNAEEVYAATASTLSTMSLSQAITDINQYIADNNFDVAEIKYDYMPGLPEYAYHSNHGWNPENGVVGKPEGVVLHDVGNDNSTIYGEIEYMTSNQDNAFVHAFVDANSIIQVADTDYLAYGAGPVSNQLHMHVELVRHDNAHDFAKSINNYADYIANLLYKYKLPAVSADETGEGTLWSHVAVSNHLGGTASPDPYEYFARFNYEYNDVISLITDRYNDMYNKRTNPQISMPIEQGTTDLMAEVNSNNLGLYESVTDVRTKNANDLLGQQFRVVRTATYNYDDYYLLEDANGVSLGWMYAGDLTTSEYVPEDEDKKPEAPKEPAEPKEPEEDKSEDDKQDKEPTPEKDSEDENREQEKPAKPETPEEPAEKEDSTEDNNKEPADNSDNKDEDTADKETENDPANEPEENNNAVTDDSDGESSEPETEVSDEDTEDADQDSEANEETTEADTVTDGEVSSSLADAATGVRVVSATDELDGKSLVVTALNPSGAINAAHDLYDIHILDENGLLYNLQNPATVYLPANGYVSNVYYLGDIGETLEAVNYTTADGYAVFGVNSFSQYAVVYGNETEDNTTMPVLTGDNGTGGEEGTADKANEHQTVYTETDVNTEDEAAPAGSDDANQGGSGEEAEPEMLPDTGVPEQSTTIFATILAALGLGFLVKRRKTTEK